jgi:VWFA-related protein
MRPSAAVILLVAAAGASFSAQQTFRSGVDVTGITVSVRDADGHLVAGLTREDFDIYEDGEKQVLTAFTRERVPVSLGVLLDVSDSMFGTRIRDARAAVDRFLFDLLDPADEFFLMAFNHKPRPQTGWTRSRDEIRRALEALKPTGGTAIYDAIFEALPILERRTRERAALLVISDGADTASAATLREVRSALLRSDTFVYAIAIDSADPKAINARVNAEALRDITSQSGGRTEIVRTSADLADATARIADELNSQYLIGYTSPKGADGAYHSIRLKVAGSDYRVRARNGFIATKQ